VSRYDLLLESGPKRRKTMVHVPKLLGCCVMGPTTDGALDVAPDEIRAFLRWAAAHGEEADPRAPITTRVVEHVTTGDFLGQGGAVFAWDDRTLTGADVDDAAGRWEALRADLLADLRGVTRRRLDAKPASGDRPLGYIALHVLGAARGYLSSVFGGTPEIGRNFARVEKGELDVLDALEAQAPLLRARLDQLADVRARSGLPRPHRITRGVRRLLEHEWEHLREIRRRLK
jgi:hypothetical protein